MKYLITFLLAVASFSAVAETKWEGEGELGYLLATGNTETESLVSRFKLIYTRERWKHTGQLEAINSSESEERTAESYTAKTESDYSMSEKYYAFGSTRYEDNRFSGYEYQAAGAAGFGVHVIQTEATTFDLRAGLGYRRSEEQDTQETLEEAIIRLSSKYYTQLTETTRFEGDLLVESGEENIYTEATLAVKVKINDHLAMKAGYGIKNNSDVPADTEHTDTLTSVSLTYSF